MLSSVLDSLDNLGSIGGWGHNNYESKSCPIYHKEFALLLRLEVFDLCALCNQFLVVTQDCPDKIVLNNGGIYRFIMECTRCEDLLDQVHADQQTEWAYIRRLAALIKHSCSIIANLQYLAIFAEKLIGAVEGNFALANHFVLQRFHRFLIDNAQNFLNEMWRLKILKPDDDLPMVFAKYFSSDIYPLIHLQTKKPLKAEQPTDNARSHGEEYILSLISTLLQNCDIIGYLSPLQKKKNDKREEIIAQELHEEALTAQRELFHGVITSFDTQCLQKQIIAEQELINVISHVKIIYNLLMSLSILMRIQERHYPYFVEQEIEFSMDKNTIEEIIFDFFINYINRFRLEIERISKRLITIYSVQQKIDLPIPSYRGFHVRPSTLVARIVMHYGSKVVMRLKDISYNAAVPLDLFRANEVINAEKRREIGQIVAENKECKEQNQRFQRLRKYFATDTRQTEIQEYSLKLFQGLESQKKIFLYDTLSIDLLEKPSLEEELLEYIKRQIAYLMALGKLDIASDMKVHFEGDSRVLADIRILAEHGYGEDQAGSNIPLPKELSYLRGH